MDLLNIEEYYKTLTEYADLNIDWDLLRDKTFLITGATGMIGKCLIDLIMYKNITDDLNCTVIALGRNKEKAVNRLGAYFNDRNFDFIEVDVNKPFDINYDKVNYMLHAASSTHPIQYSTNPIGTITTNVIGLYNILELAVAKKTDRVLFASSVEIYGENRRDVEKFDENYLGYINCNTVRAGYSESKRTGEALCQAYIKQNNLDIVIPRLSRVFGPTMLMSDSKASSQFIKNGINEEDIVLKSKGLQNYSYSYVFDAVMGLLTCLAKGKCGEAYNISDSKFDVTLSEFAKTCAESVGKEVIFDIPDETEKAGYSTATKALLDSTKLNELGWQASGDFKTRVDETIRILKKVKQ